MPSPRYWREIPSRYRLEAGRCRGCGRVSYPLREVCPACRETDLEQVTLSPHGKVITSTVIQVPPTEFQFEAPYGIAVIETEEGARLMAQVVDCDPDSIVPGFRVELEFRLIGREGDAGILCYGHKAVPESNS